MRFASLTLVLLVTAACGGTSTDDGQTTTEAGAVASTTSTAAVSTTAAPDPTAACDHAYVPTRVGSRWTYRMQDGSEVDWVIVSAEEAGAVLEAVLPGESGPSMVTVNITCDASGIAAPELGFAGFPGGVTVKQLEADGVFLLPAEDLQPGATWMASVSLTAEFEDTPGFEVQIMREVTYTVVGLEPVEVPAGTFDALRVRSDFTITIDTGTNLVTNMGSEEIWFVEGIGIVREASGGSGPSFSTELVEYSPA
jgi:hypothetical protein